MFKKKLDIPPKKNFWYVLREPRSQMLFYLLYLLL